MKTFIKGIEAEMQNLIVPKSFAAESSIGALQQQL